MRKTRKVLCIFLLLVLVAGMLAGCAPAKEKHFESMEDFAEAKIGVLTGSTFDLYTREYYPKAERLSFMNITDLILNLQQGKIDGILMDMGFFTPLAWENTGLSYIPVDMPATKYAVAFPKTGESDALRAQFNAFYYARKESGWMDELGEKWFAKSEPSGKLDLSQLSGENGTLRVATTVESKPYEFLRDGQVCGYDIDFLYAFAEEYGYALSFDIMDFSALLPSINAGKYDLAISSITVTEERKESVNFSDVYYESPIVMAVLADKTTADANEKSYEKIADFANAKIGIMTGSSQELIVKKMFPEAERVYFSRQADMVLAVEQGKIDGYMFGSPFLAATIWENANVKRLDEAVSQGDIAFGFPQNEASDPLREQLNTFLQKAKQDGTMDRLKNKWLGKSEPTEHPDYASLTGENGTIRLAAVAENKPLIYQYQNQCTGLEMELLTLFAEEYGYRFDIEVVPFDSVIMGMSTGKYDIASASLQITAEREESINFSTPYMQFDVVMVVKGNGTDAVADGGESGKTLSDYANAKIGIMTGSSHDGTAKEIFPDAQRVYFNTVADMVLALEQGKIDGYIEDAPFMATALWEGSKITRLEESIKQVDNGFAFPQSEDSRALREQFNAFLAAAKADGTIDALKEKWLGDTEPTEHPDYTTLSGENGTIRLAVAVENKPSIYLKDNLCTGFEMDLLALFGQQYGYKFETEAVPFGSVIAGIAAGKYDMAAASLNITPEREESVDFSDPYTSYDVVMAVSSVNRQKAGKTLADFETANIGVQTGSVYDDYSAKLFPNAQRYYYSLVSDMILAMEQGKIDGFLSDRFYAIAARWEGAKIQVVEEPIDQTNAGFIFAKSEKPNEVFEELNAFILASKENGLTNKLRQKWFGDTEPTEFFDPASLTGEKGTLKVVVCPDLKPMCYMKNGVTVGYDVEFLQHFAKEYGYNLEFVCATFDTVLPGVVSGRYDIGAAAITITDERKQSVDFTESYLSAEVVMVVNEEEDVPAQASFWDTVKESFEKTFIRENRWKLIVEGVGVTMLISLCAAVAGTLLGFGLYMLSRSDAKFLQSLAKAVATVYSRIVAGTPIVVILMILFYVVFGKFRDMSGILVAIIGFTLTFGAFVYDHMVVSVSSVDFGQTEAAFALGYPKNKTFFRIIFPQAMTIFLPSYCSQAVELIKATAVVGYVAVNDLTKMGDIIRSNTYEAFFPLIATAVIYFLLTWVLSLLLKLLKRRFEPKRRDKDDILKGVKTV